MGRSRTEKRRNGTDAAWLAVLAMLCQLLAPALYAPHQAAMALELAEVTGGHHHRDDGGRPAGDPSTCLVHMALHAAASAAAPPPPAIPLRLASLPAIGPQAAVDILAEQWPWRPQASRAPPCPSDHRQA